MGSGGASAGSVERKPLVGLILSHKPHTDIEASSTPAEEAPSATGGVFSRLRGSGGSFLRPASAAPHEVVSPPTMYNASFPFAMPFETAPRAVATNATSPLLFLYKVNMDTISFLDLPCAATPDPYPRLLCGAFLVHCSVVPGCSQEGGLRPAASENIIHWFRSVSLPQSALLSSD